MESLSDTEGGGGAQSFRPFEVGRGVNIFTLSDRHHVIESAHRKSALFQEIYVRF